MEMDWPWMLTAPVRAAPVLAATAKLMVAGPEPLADASVSHGIVAEALHGQPAVVAREMVLAPPSAGKLPCAAVAAYVQAEAAWVMEKVWSLTRREAVCCASVFAATE